MSKAPSARPAAGDCTDNILAISQLEREALDRRSAVEKFSDALVHHAGRFWFILLHAIWFGAWILWNVHLFPGRPFDPFPFPALTTAVSLEAIFLSLFLLMSQNRSNRHADERAHLDLQVNLLAERETTKMLQMLQALCEHANLPEANDPELKKLLQRTDPAKLAAEISRQLPADAPQ